MSRLSSWRSLIILQLLSAIAAAQEPGCDFGDDRVNATGITPFRFESQQDDWYSSLAFSYPYRSTQDLNPEETSIGGILPFFKTYLSVPRVTPAEACQWTFSYLNKTATGPGLNGCEGLLSQECVDRLRDLATNSAAASCSTSQFPTQWHTKSRDVCGDDLFGAPPESSDQPKNSTSYETLATSPDPAEMCDASPPRMELPEEDGSYGTVAGAPLVTKFVPNRPLDDVTAYESEYDSWIRRSWIHIYTATFDGSTNMEAQVVCVSARNIVDGSRIPDNWSPPPEPSPASTSTAATPTETGSAMRVDLRGSASLMVIAAGLVGLVWTL